MAKYEITFIYPKDEKDYAKTLEGYLKEIKAKVEKKEDWGVKKMTYLIKKQKEARYLYLEVEMEAAAAKELEAKIKLDEVILRHLIIRK